MSDWLYDGERFFVDEGDALAYANLDPVMWVSPPPDEAMCHIEEIVRNRHWRVTWGEPQETHGYVKTHDVMIIPAGFGWRVIERDAPRLRVVT